MSSDTTIALHLDRRVHQRLTVLAAESNQPISEVLRDAVEALERVRFAARAAQQLLDLTDDPEKRIGYLTDGELAVSDGLT